MFLWENHAVQGPQHIPGTVKVVVMSLFGLEKVFDVTPLLFLQSQKMETDPREVLA